MRRLDTLQNLILMMFADHEISPSEEQMIERYAKKIGIPKEKYQPIIDNLSELDFVIPSKETERLEMLQQLATLSVIDGEIAEEEYEALQNFASRCGITDGKLDDFIKQAVDQFDHEAVTTIENNQYQYDLLHDQLLRTGLSDKQIVSIIEQRIEAKDLNTPLSDNEETNRALWELLWSIYHRYVKLGEGGYGRATTQLKMIMAGNQTLEDLIYSFKFMEHAYFEGFELQFHQMSIEDLKNDLRHDSVFKN